MALPKDIDARRYYRVAKQRSGEGGTILVGRGSNCALGRRKDVVMATITRGSQDALVGKFKTVLDEYERQNPGAAATLYRQNSVSIRIRIVDESFAHLSKPARHDRAWKFISDRLDDEELQDISVLLLLSPKEQRSSFMNVDFDDPIPSTL